MEDKLFIGKIVGTHGLKGEVKIKSVSSFNDIRFKKGNVVYLTKNKRDFVELTCISHRVHKNMDLVAFENMQDINLVEKYRDYEVYALYDRDLLDDDEYFYKDIIGCKVYDQDEQLIGEVTSIMENPLYDILEVSKLNQNKLLIPYINQFIIEEDIYNHKIVVRFLEGM